MVKIIKIAQKKKYYEITFTNDNFEETLTLPLDIISKYDLIYKDEIEIDIYKILKKESDFIDDYLKVSKYLKKCESSYELEKFIEKEINSSSKERIYALLESLNSFNDTIYIQNYLYVNLRKKLGRKYTYDQLVKMRLEKAKIDEEILVYDDNLLKEFMTYHINKTFISYRGSKKAFYYKAYNNLLRKFFSSDEISLCNDVLLEYKEKVDEKRHLLNDFEKIIDKYYFLENKEEMRHGFLNELMKKGYEKEEILKLIKEY